MKISEHITYREATFSATAIRKGIPNDPDENQLKNMQILAEAVFEPLRKGLGDKPIKITSFFRSRALNSIIGGASKSQHCEGMAMDLDSEDPTNRQIFDYIKDNLTFDQLILEYPDTNDNPSWVHVSYNIDNNRMQILRCINGHYYAY